MAKTFGDQTKLPETKVSRAARRGTTRMDPPQTFKKGGAVQRGSGAAVKGNKPAPVC